MLESAEEMIVENFLWMNCLVIDAWLMEWCYLNAVTEVLFNGKALPS